MINSQLLLLLFSVYLSVFDSLTLFDVSIHSMFLSVNCFTNCSLFGFQFKRCCPVNQWIKKSAVHFSEHDFWFRKQNKQKNKNKIKQYSWQSKTPVFVNLSVILAQILPPMAVLVFVADRRTTMPWSVTFACRAVTLVPQNLLVWTEASLSAALYWWGNWWWLLAGKMWIA